MATPALGKTVYYPRESCAEIVSSEYSTGNGNSSLELFEILCKSDTGIYTSFITSWSSAAGLIGWGRVFHEERFDFVPYNGNKLKVD